jgi:hypothetical protein
MPSPELSDSLLSRTPCRVRQAPDNQFDASELLFHRLAASTFCCEDGHPDPQCFISTPLSVNRSRYSTALCVLCDRLYQFERPTTGDKIIQFTVSSLDKSLMGLAHTPDPRNYSHCDISRGDRLPRKLFRTHLSDSATTTEIKECRRFVSKD